MAVFNVILLVISLALPCALAQSNNCAKPTCPNGWVSYESSCYLFEDTTILNWTAAASYCSNHDANLAVIESSGEDQLLINMAKRLFKACTGPSHPYFWIGANDMDAEGQWIWYTNNQSLGKTYTNWSPVNNEPDDIGNEDCALMYGAYHFAWGSGSCLAKGHYICEMKYVVYHFTNLTI